MLWKGFWGMQQRGQDPLPAQAGQKEDLALHFALQVHAAATLSFRRACAQLCAVGSNRACDRSQWWQSAAAQRCTRACIYNRLRAWQRFAGFMFAQRDCMHHMHHVRGAGKHQAFRSTPRCSAYGGFEIWARIIAELVLVTGAVWAYLAVTAETT